jgi:hypothetical protein
MLQKTMTKDGVYMKGGVNMRGGIARVKRAEPVAEVGKVPIAAIGNTEHRNYNATFGRPQITVATCRKSTDII